MKKVLASVALAAAALAAPLVAQAGVLRSTITFDPVPASPFTPFAPLLTNGDEFYQSGIGGRTMFFDTFSNSQLAQPGDLVGAILDGACANLLCPTNNATSYLAMLDDAVAVFGHADGFTFSLKSVDASFIGSGDPFGATPGYLALQGVRNGQSLTAYFALSGLDANGMLNFGTINTGAFGNYEFDYIYAYGYACQNTSCSAFSTNQAQFALDNLVIEHVPEPASLALVFVAGAALAGARRRKAA